MVFFFKQKTAYEMRISDWSSDVCSSDLVPRHAGVLRAAPLRTHRMQVRMADPAIGDLDLDVARPGSTAGDVHGFQRFVGGVGAVGFDGHRGFLVPGIPRLCGHRLLRSGEHTSELKYPTRNSYAVYT